MKGMPWRERLEKTSQVRDEKMLQGGEKKTKNVKRR